MRYSNAPVFQRRRRIALAVVVNTVMTAVMAYAVYSFGEISAVNPEDIRYGWFALSCAAFGVLTVILWLLSLSIALGDDPTRTRPRTVGPTMPVIRTIPADKTPQTGKNTAEKATAA